MTVSGLHKIPEQKEAAFDLIGGKSQGGSIYAIDHDEMLRLAFKQHLNPEIESDKTQLNQVWARMPTMSKWKRYSARHEDGNILFCKNVKTNEFSYCYSLYNC